MAESELFLARFSRTGCQVHSYDAIRALARLDKVATIQVVEFLEETEWNARATSFEARIDSWLRNHATRNQKSEKHAVFDFLFTYYSFKPSQLRSWSPGINVRLLGARAADFLSRRYFVRFDDGVGVCASRISQSRVDGIRWIAGLLATTSQRPAAFGCFGLHEWAMLHRAERTQIRHAVPLRMKIDEISAVVESSGVNCTHFDAFRHFTPSAFSLNSTQLSRSTVVANEQAGCLHVNMDLYKWSMKLAPFAPSELVADCLELAIQIREIDMRASPYDLSELGYLPIKIETPEGRAEYTSHQRHFFEKSKPLRERLLGVCNSVMAQIDAPLSEEIHKIGAINK